MTLEETRETIAEARQRSPDAVRLAEALCLAARVEPELLRAARFELFEDIEAGAEADLWFGPLVDSRSPHAVVLKGEVAAELRTQIIGSGRSDHLSRAWGVLERMHADAPTGIKLQEQITWMTTLGGATSADVESILQSVVSAIATDAERSSSLARWAAHALPQLPDVAQSTRGASVLSVVASAHLGGQPVLEALRLEAADLPAVALALPTDLHRVWVGVRLVSGGVEVGDPPAWALAAGPRQDERFVSSGGVHAVAVPRTQPVVLALVSETTAGSSQTIATWRPGEVHHYAIDTDRVEVRTVDGAVYRLTPAPASESGPAAPLERPPVDAGNARRREIQLQFVPDQVCVQLRIAPAGSENFLPVANAVAEWLGTLVGHNLEALQYQTDSKELRADLEPVELRRRYQPGQDIIGGDIKVMTLSSWTPGTRDIRFTEETWCVVYDLVGGTPNLQLTDGDRREAVREIVNLLNLRALEQSSLPEHLLQPLRGIRACTLLGAFPNWLTRAPSAVPPSAVHETGNWRLEVADDSPSTPPKDVEPRVVILDASPDGEQLRRATARFPDNRLFEALRSTRADRPFDGSSHGPMADHGLFAAGIVRDLAPNAELVLQDVLDANGVGDLASLIGAFDRAMNSTPRRQIVCLGLTLLIPLDVSSDWLPSTSKLESLSERDRSAVVRLLGMTTSFDEVLRPLDDPNVLVIAPVGDGTVAGSDWPALRPPAPGLATLGVAAIGTDGRLAPYSNQPGSASILAPGDLVGLWSSDTLPDGQPNTTGWVHWSSTAFAAAVVAGVAARWWSNEPDLTAEDLRRRLLSASPIHGASQLASTISAADEAPTSEAPPTVESPAPVARTSADIAELYNFPRQLDGTGQCIGILELGDFRLQDVQALETQHRAFFAQHNLPMPRVSLVGLDQTSRRPPNENAEMDWKLGMDIQVIGAAAPGASLVMYFAPNTEDGYRSALKTAIEDTVNHPTVLYLGWGAPESSWTPQALQLINAELQRATEFGISVVVPAGDSGSSDGVQDSKPHVDFPASSPWVLACGGTQLLFDDSGAIADEIVWSDGDGGSATGGGVSATFRQPEWQQPFEVPNSPDNPTFRGRGVPDVAAYGAAAAYLVHVNDQDGALGGSSAAAALWCALIARLNQALGSPVGHITPRLYELKLRDPSIFREITRGTNGAYTAGPGWNACAGLGSVDGSRLLDALRSSGPSRLSA